MTDETAARMLVNLKNNMVQILGLPDGLFWIFTIPQTSYIDLMVVSFLDGDHMSGGEGAMH